ncbi:FadR/GntR family transcriptional regulator [Psychromicrobium lacuslunae]|uniref:Transcriptional regulator n=1 Tax=Psychromicrobium lacuslunae TaxID=1618207 RepID=A0A0D4BXV6_9MICC|nr:FCD domain-containing protein [Psychromicrobium lacuslunae]AJT40951.1 transcriptional regulator [Psychromicrobium lacuslunae]
MEGVRGNHLSFVDSFGQQIVDGLLAPGQILLTEELQERFAATRSVAREGIRVIQALGLVAVTRNVGVRVQSAEQWNVFDRKVIHWRLNGPQRTKQLLSITELRLGVEPLAARLAAERIGVAQGRELTGLAGELLATGNAGDLEAFLAADIAYHSLILRAAENEMFAHLHEAVGEVLSGRTEHGLMPERPHAQARHWHLGVAEAIQQGDGATAEELMRHIVLLAGQELRQELGLSTAQK